MRNDCKIGELKYIIKELRVMDWNIAGLLYVPIIFNVVFEITKFIAVLLFIKVCITYLNKN